MRAIACGHQSVVKIFLEFGCKVDSVVRHQKTLLEWAIENEYNVLIEVNISQCVGQSMIVLWYSYTPMLAFDW